MVMQTFKHVAAIALLAVTPFVTAQAQLYKWVDENGVTNYGDAPPKSARKTTALDATKSSLSVVPGLSKDELARLEARVEQARADRLERENSELRARLVATPPAPPAPRYDDQVAYGPIYVPQVVTRRVPRDPLREPVRGRPVQKSPPVAGMRLDR
jgi:hypothetical protein